MRNSETLPEDQVDIPQHQELKVNPQCSNLSRQELLKVYHVKTAKMGGT